MATGIVSKRLRFDLFTKYVDNIYSEPAIKWYLIYSILIIYFFTISMNR